MKLISIPAMALLVVACLFFQACNSATLTITLDAVTIAADAALSDAESNGSLAPGQEQQVATVIADVTNATQLATTELAGTDPETLKFANVTAYYQPVIAEIGQLSGFPPKVQASIIAVSVSIQAVLRLIPAPTAGAKFAAMNGKPLLSSKDFTRLFAHAASVGLKAHLAMEAVKK